MEKITKVSVGSDGLHSSFLPHSVFRSEARRPSSFADIIQPAPAPVPMPGHRSGVSMVTGTEDSDDLNKRIAEKLRQVLRKINKVK